MQQYRNYLVEQWYAGKSWGWLLWPAAKLFAWGVNLRKKAYERKYLKSYKASVPVIVVGNITVGGTGKTPLVIYLAQMLRNNGYRPGIVTRGYKGLIKSLVLVSPNSDPKVVSDEAVLLAQRTNCPVMIARKRSVAARHLIRHHKVDVIISDDGLQHYALERDIEIAVIDGDRRFGNGHCLPMGPLREPVSRLASVDLLVVNNSKSNEPREQTMQLACSKIYALTKPNIIRELKDFAGKTVHAIAGIGYPERFFQQLRAAGLEVIPHSFADHHAFSPADISFVDALPVLMTEKDAVKCKCFASAKHWVVAVDAQLPEDFSTQVIDLVKGFKHAG